MNIHPLSEDFRVLCGGTYDIVPKRNSKWTHSCVQLKNTVRDTDLTRNDGPQKSFARALVRWQMLFYVIKAQIMKLNTAGLISSS
jgi:hypothetical protein